MYKNYDDGYLPKLLKKNRTNNILEPILLARFLCLVYSIACDTREHIVLEMRSYRYQLSACSMLQGLACVMLLRGHGYIPDLRILL